MQIVTSIKEIEQNLKTLDIYRCSGSGREFEYYLDKIKRGTCFLVYSNGKSNCFAPSRFIGYANNTIDKHEANHSKDGRETTPKISKLLGKDCVFDEELEKSYREFCQALGFEANDTGAFGVKRKYWVL